MKLWRSDNPIDDDEGVSTGSGSDRVTVLAISTLARVETRSLPLPVPHQHDP